MQYVFIVSCHQQHFIPLHRYSPAVLFFMFISNVTMNKTVQLDLCKVTLPCQTSCFLVSEVVFACSMSFSLPSNALVQWSIIGCLSAICIYDRGVKVNYTLQLQGEPKNKKKKYQFKCFIALSLALHYSCL